VFVKKQIRVAEEKKNDHFSYKCNVSIVVVFFFFLILHNFMLSWVSKYVTLKEQVVQKGCLQKSYGNLNFLSFFLKVSFFIKR
jgi:hypothetical protein